MSSIASLSAAPVPRRLLLALLAAFTGPLAAQSPPSDSADAPAAATLPPRLITGNPLGQEVTGTPATVIQGEALVLRRGSSLAETLSGTPGVAATAFGPNANRPLIRGLDGDRIRILNNGGASLDASGLSFDHAVPIDPLAVTRIEVLRGPAALLYGGSAIGGVVNALDRRIATETPEGVEGAVELRGGGAAREEGASAVLDATVLPGAAAGTGLVLHVDAFRRRTEDLRTPRYDRPDGAGGSTRADRVLNSASRAEGGAVGLSWVGRDGHLGLALDRYENRYGIVAEEDVTIRMKQDKLALAGEWRWAQGPLRRLSGRVQDTDYRHAEVEGDGAVGTRFGRKGQDARFEAEHAPLGAMRGVLGLQLERSRFSALGEEAFLPATRSRQQAVFLHEELPLGALLGRAPEAEAAPAAGATRQPGRAEAGDPRGLREPRLSFGARLERSRIASAGDAPGADPQFGDAQSRRFTARSLAAGLLWPLASGWQASANLARSERAPTDYELYANGLHLATAAFEQGDPGLPTERARSLDLGLAWQSGPARISGQLYRSDFSRFIGLIPTGADADTDEGPVPIYAFQPVRARFTGFELEGHWRWTHGRGEGAHWTELGASLDRVRAENLSAGEALPRIPPQRLGLSLAHGWAGWTLRAEARHAARQDRVPAEDEATPSSTVLNLAASHRWRLADDREALFFLRLDNLTDELAYNASTIATVRRLAPLGGRSVSAGLRFSY